MECQTQKLSMMGGVRITLFFLYITRNVYAPFYRRKSSLIEIAQ